MTQPVKNSSGIGAPSHHTPAAAPKKGRLRGGVGDDPGGINPPPRGEGLSGFFSSAYEMVMIFLRFVHGSLIYCVPIHSAKSRRGQGEDFAWFMTKWFPETMSFLLADDKEVMIQQLEGLSKAKFQVILTAYNKKEEKALGPETSPKDFINGLTKNITLDKGDFEEHPELICPYGLKMDGFKRDLERLPVNTRLALAAYSKEAPMDEYFRTNEGMGRLKFILSDLNNHP